MLRSRHRLDGQTQSLASLAAGHQTCMQTLAKQQARGGDFVASLPEHCVKVSSLTVSWAPGSAPSKARVLGGAAGCFGGLAHRTSAAAPTLQASAGCSRANPGLVQCILRLHPLPAGDGG